MKRCPRCARIFPARWRMRKRQCRAHGETDASTWRTLKPLRPRARSATERIVSASGGWPKRRWTRSDAVGRAIRADECLGCNGQSSRPHKYRTQSVGILQSGARLAAKRSSFAFKARVHVQRPRMLSTRPGCWPLVCGRTPSEDRCCHSPIETTTAELKVHFEIALSGIRQGAPPNCRNWVSTSLSYPLHLVSEAAMTAD